MGCGNDNQKIAFTDPADPDSVQSVFKIIKSESRRASGDVYLITVEKSADVVFPLGGAVVFYIQGK